MEYNFGVGQVDEDEEMLKQVIALSLAEEEERQKKKKENEKP